MQWHHFWGTLSAGDSKEKSIEKSEANWQVGEAYLHCLNKNGHLMQIKEHKLASSPEPNLVLKKNNFNKIWLNSKIYQLLT